MRDGLVTRIKRRLWTQSFGEASWISKTGDFRTRERHGLIGRPNYLYGMLRAADCAKYFGKTSVMASELGGARGGGLVNMVALVDPASIATSRRRRRAKTDRIDGEALV